MMMSRTDDLSPSQFGVPERDALRQRMLQHETIFRSQVRELHRLYWTQKNLMREQQQQQKDFWKEAKGKCIDINETPLADFENVAFDNRGDTERSARVSSLHCCEVTDLEKPRTHVAGTEIHSPWWPVSVDVPPSSGARNVPPLVEAVDYLHAGPSNSWRGRMPPCSDSGFCETSAVAFVAESTDSTHKPPTPISKILLIDLNIAQEDESSHDFNNPMLTSTSPSSSSSVVQYELLSRDEGNGPKETWASLKPDAPKPTTEISEGKDRKWRFHCYQSQNSTARETIQNHGHESALVQGSTCKCSGPTDFPRKLVEEFSSPNEGIIYSTKVATFSSTKFGETVEGNANSSTGKQPSITHSSSRRQTSVITSINDIEMKQANHEGCEEDTVSSHAIAQDDKKDVPLTKFPTDNKCIHMAGGSCDISSHEKSLGENSGTTHLESQVAEQFNRHREDEGEEMDRAITRAAEALVHFSLDRSLSLVDKSYGEKDTRDSPQCSSDSFETMTVKLPEIQSEHLIPTKKFDNGGDEASGVNKFRRGRGRAIADFQRDILPGMSSLSRNEIREDMHNIGYELKRKGSAKTCEENWFVPVRSRPSRRCSARRTH